MRRSWWHQWFEGRVAGDAEALQVLLTRACRQETALAFHLADRARARHFLERRGVIVVDVPPEELSVAAVNKYLELKERGRI